MTELAENPQDSFDPCLARRCSARTIVDAAADGTLTADRITHLIAEAARAQSIATYTGELRQRTERLFVGAFYEALQDGAADEILDSLRPAFDTAAEAIAQARDLIPVETPAEMFLHSAKPAALSAWQSLDDHLATIAARAAPRNGRRRVLACRASWCRRASCAGQYALRCDPARRKAARRRLGERAPSPTAPRRCRG